ncbi:MAG: DUF4340 domain-containing protein [Candidatus Eisenbacteria bacterium]
MADANRIRTEVALLLVVLSLHCGGGGEEDGALVFPRFPDPILRFDIENDSTTAALAVRDGVWWIVSPIEDRADSSMIDGLIRSLRGAAVLGIADEDPPFARSYGLRPPRARVTVGGREILVGLRSPGGEGVYISEPGVKRVLLATGKMAPILDLPLRRLRDHRLLRFPPSEVRRVSVEQRGRSWTIERRGDDRWFVAEAGLRADPKFPWGVVRAVNVSRIHSFSEETEFREGPRPFRVTVGWAGGEGTLEIGDAVPETSLLLARATDRPGLFRLPRYVRDSLFAHAAEPLDRSLLGLDPLEADRVRLIEGGNEVCTLARTGKGWTVTKGETFPADPARTRAWLRNLGNLEAIAFLPPGAPDEEVTPRWTVEADGETVSVIEGGAGFVARREGERGALILPDGARAVFSVTLGDLLVPATPPER